MKTCSNINACVYSSTEIKCTVPLIENGYVPDRDIREYKEHDVLQLMCNDRYKPTEDRPSKCTKVGIRAEWTPTPACERKYKLINAIYWLYHTN